MNCAESQDLLLDLAYGELPPSRAAEVEAHVQGCAACRAEKEQLDDARRVTAPLREVEQPSAAFDEPILRAAKAEAGMQADGTPGPVVEVSASVKPLGLQAARLDPHARMKGTPGSARPRWRVRAAVFGSIAAAAALAVVVTSSLRPDRSSEMAREEVAPIQVRPPGSPVSSAFDGALAHRDRGGEANENLGGKSADTAPPQPAAPPAAVAKKKAAPPKKEEPAPLLAEKDVGDRLARARATQGVAGGTTVPARTDASAAAPKAVDEGRAQRAKEQKLEAKGPPPPPPEERPVDLASRSAPPAAAPSEPRSAAAVAPDPRYAPPAPQAKDPDRVEEDASAARRRGDYVRAAALYREASALRRAADPARAAWDMAHAVECLAAGGQVDEAIAARKELLRVFPGQTGPKAAADSALRSVRLPPDDETPAKQ